MVSKLTASQLAEKKGVSKATVSQMTKRGRITRGPDDLYDMRLPENAAYLATKKTQQRTTERTTGRRRGGKPAGKSEQPSKPSKPKRDPGGKLRAQIPAGGGQLRFDGETWDMADLRKKVSDANKVEQENAVRRGELVERADVRKVFAKVYTIIASQVKPLPEKYGSDVAAGFNLPEGSIPRVQELMSIDTLRALGQIKAEFNVYLDTIGEELLDAE
jgi:phage terminase Nu1 subunit (DNA packaging protein)